MQTISEASLIIIQRQKVFNKHALRSLPINFYQTLRNDRIKQQFLPTQILDNNP